MFATIRRHQKWLWAAIIAVIIPSFVVFFSPNINPGGGGGSSSDFGSLNGRPISRQQYADAYRETEIFYYLNYGTWPDRQEANRFGFDVDREARSRLLLVSKLNENHIKVSDEAVAKWISNAFQDRKQHVFRMDAYNKFIQQDLGQRGISAQDFQRFVAHQVGIQELINVYGLNGKLVPPQAAETMYRREHEPVDAEAVLFSASNYLASVTVNSNVLVQYYTNHLSVYRIPDRVQVSYVKFDLTNFMAEAQQQLAKDTNLDLKINGYYQQQGPNFFTDTNGNVLPEAEAKAKLKKDLLHDAALQAATKKASQFAVDLFKITPMRAENLYTLAASNHYQVRVTEPFSAYEGPKELKVPENFARAAMSLTPDEPFSQPMHGEDGVYIIALYKNLPSEVPPLDAIRLRVAEDYRRSEALRLARQDGEKFSEQLTNALAQGKSFAAVCAEAKVKPLPLPKFSLSTRDLPTLDSRLDLSSLRELVAALPPGKASRFTLSRDGGYIVYLQARLPVDEAEMKKDFPEYLQGLRQARQSQAFNEWFSHQVVLAKLSAPASSKSKTAPGEPE